MNLGSRLAVMSDIHGAHRMLERALYHCRNTKVDSIVLLGDLFDRIDQAEACARHLSTWPVAGVIGNHEREALHNAGSNVPAEIDLAARLVTGLGDQFHFEGALFVHDELDWKPHIHNGGACPSPADVRVVFAGHTHYRLAKDDRGPIDLSLGRIELRSERTYMINPGAVIEGQFAIWDRNDETVMFERI